MSLILKEVNGSVYVKGGPECKAEKYGAGLIGWKCDNGFKYHDQKHTLSRIEPYYGTECPECHGTGTLPVHLWPDAVKAEWLGKLGYNFCCDISPKFDEPEILLYEITVEEFGDEVALVGKYEEYTDFSQALTAAVIAVAKEVAA